MLHLHQLSQKRKCVDKVIKNFRKFAIYFGQNKFFEYYIRVNDIVGQNYEKSKKSR